MPQPGCKVAGRVFVGRLECFVEQPPNATEFGQGFEKEVTG